MRSGCRPFFYLLGLLLGAPACTPVGLLNATVPGSGYTVHRDIAYGDAARQALDIYVPEGLTEPAPVIVFFYGGAWQGGHKRDYLFVGQALASKGFIAVIADYRVYPDVSFPMFLKDSAKAVAWAHANIGAYKGDAQNLYLAGHSAGAYNAAMLAVDPRYLTAAGMPSSSLRGMIGLAGPYDFLPLTDPKLIALFGSATDDATQPVHYVDGPKMPMLLVTGDKDKEVLPRNTRRMAEKLRAHGSDVETRTYPGVAHIGIVLSLARGFRYKTTALEDIAGFVARTKSSP